MMQDMIYEADVMQQSMRSDIGKYAGACVR